LRNIHYYADQMHIHGDSANTEKRIGLAFALNTLFVLVEIAGGFWTGSVAIISDAVHDLGDSMFLGTSFLIQKISSRKNDSRFTYGYRRFNLLASIFNGIVLIAGSSAVLYESFSRLFEHHAVYAPGMILLAIPGILINGYGAYRVNAGKTMLEKVISLHLLEDVLGWVVILISGIVLIFYDIPYIDPVLSIVLISFTLWNALRLMVKTVYLFLQGVPDSLDMNKIEKEILCMDGIHSVHAYHAWSLDGDNNVVTMHVVLNSKVSDDRIHTIRRDVKSILSDYRVNHATVEIEQENEFCENRNQ